jgi:tetratricopeptide (TPR) repeat protein
VLRLYRKVLGREHPNTLTAVDNLAESYFATGRREESLTLRQESLTLRCKVFGPEHPGTLQAIVDLAASYGAASRRDEELKLVEEALPLLRDASARNPADTEKGKHVATVHLWLGETNEHRAICRRMLEWAANSKDPAAHDRAAKAYLLQAHPDPVTLKQAVAAGRQALKLAAPNDANRGWFLVTAALAAIRDGVPAEAEPLLTETLKVPGGSRELRSLVLACKVMALAQLHRTNEAQAEFAELEKVKPGIPAPPALSAIVLQPDADAMAVALLYEEAKALLNDPVVTRP